MSNDLTKNISKLNDSAKNYFQAKVDLIKISLLEKSTKITAMLINILIFILLIFWMLGFAVAAFAAWYGNTYNDYPKGILIAAGIMLILVLLFIVFRKSIITTSVLRYYSRIIFEDENEKKDE